MGSEPINCHLFCICVIKSFNTYFVFLCVTKLGDAKEFHNKPVIVYIWLNHKSAVVVDTEQNSLFYSIRTRKNVEKYLKMVSHEK